MRWPAISPPTAPRSRVPAGHRLRRLDRLVLVACGTAHYACHVAKYWFESLARLPVEIEVASEFRYREPPLGRDARHLRQPVGRDRRHPGRPALRPRPGQTTVAVVNVETSTIARESDLVLPILAGPEIGVASTKAFTCQLAVLAVPRHRRRPRSAAASTPPRRRGWSRRSPTAPGLVAAGAGARAADRRDRPRPRPRRSDVLFLGRGPMYPLALEGALKLKEISYIHAEGYAAGELKHGPIALIDEAVPVIVLAPSRRPLRQDRLEHAGGHGPRRQGAAGQRRRRHRPRRRTAPGARWRCRAADPFVAPIVYAAPAQLLAYHAAVLKGTDVDQPRNLAKSVTVE